MKYLKSLVVIILLFALPAGSWFFLQHGLDWRRVKRDELLPKGHVVMEKGWTTEEKAEIVSAFKGRTTLFIAKDILTSREKEVVEQFEDAYTFQSKSNSDLSANVVNILAEQHDYLLIDTGMVIRQFYSGSHDSVLIRIVEDIALIAPQRKQRDIKLKSQPDVQ